MGRARYEPDSEARARGATRHHGDKTTLRRPSRLRSIATAAARRQPPGAKTSRHSSDVGSATPSGSDADPSSSAYERGGVRPVRPPPALPSAPPPLLSLDVSAGGSGAEGSAGGRGMTDSPGASTPGSSARGLRRKQLSRGSSRRAISSGGLGLLQCVPAPRPTRPEDGRPACAPPARRWSREAPHLAASVVRLPPPAPAPAAGRFDEPPSPTGTHPPRSPGQSEKSRPRKGSASTWARLERCRSLTPEGQMPDVPMGLVPVHAALDGELQGGSDRPRQGRHGSLRSPLAGSPSRRGWVTPESAPPPPAVTPPAVPAPAEGTPEGRGVDLYSDAYLDRLMAAGTPSAFQGRGRGVQNTPEQARAAAAAERGEGSGAACEAKKKSAEELHWAAWGDQA